LVSALSSSAQRESEEEGEGERSDRPFRNPQSAIGN
jgi:hypothetical protein